MRYLDKILIFYHPRKFIRYITKQDIYLINSSDNYEKTKSFKEF